MHGLFVGATVAGFAGGALPLWRGGDPSGGRLLGWGNAFAAGQLNFASQDGPDQFQLNRLINELDRFSTNSG